MSLRRAHMMQQMATFATSNMITTELIQKYLDENKQLILAILDNQNLGKIHDCATYQAKLQQNLMYLAAIADAQPQVTHNPPQAAPAPPVQPAQQYLQQQQQQQQLLFMTQRNPIPQYLQQASQPSFYTQQAMLSASGNSGLQMFSGERGIADNGSQLSAGFSNGGSRDGNQSSIGVRGDINRGGGLGPELGMASDPLGHRDGGSGQHGGDDSETSYLKATSDASSL